MTENSMKVFNFLKDNNGMDITAQEVAKELGVTLAAVTGSVNGLVKKGYGFRNEVNGTNAEGKPIVIKYIGLTETGMAYDPEAEEAAIAREKAEKKAAREAERAAKKAAKEKAE